MVSINPDEATANQIPKATLARHDAPHGLKSISESDGASPKSSDRSNANAVGQAKKVVFEKDVADMHASTQQSTQDRLFSPGSMAKSANLTSARRNSSVGAPSEDEAIGKANLMTMQTRSTSRIAQKRVLEDAALISSDDDLPERISPPKKNRGSAVKQNTKAIAPPSDPADDKENDSSEVEVVQVSMKAADKRYKKNMASALGNDNEDSSAIEPSTVELTSNQGPIANNSNNLSVSPLKLGGAVVQQDVINDMNPFLSSPVQLKHKHADNTDETRSFDNIEQTSHGKRTANRIMLSDGELVDEEEAVMLLKVLRESRRQALIDANRHVAGQSSTSADVGTTGANEDAMNVDTSVDASPAQGLFTPSVIPSSTGLPTPSTPAQRTFKDVAPPARTTKMLGSGAKLLEDTMKYQVTKLPLRCEVTKKKEHQDPLLAESYVGLPNLRYGILRSWSSRMAPADMECVNFNEWASQCPSLDYDNAERAIRFVCHNNFINPSRVSPLDVNILYTSNDHKRAILQCNYVTTICLSPVLSRDSSILEPSPLGLRNKHITGNFHHQEWECFAGFACMVFDHKIMVAQVNNGCLSFGTMGSRADRESVSPSKPPRNPGILSSQRETKMRASGRSFKSNTMFKSVLDATDTIPVYDSRDHSFDFKEDLNRIAEKLPLYHGKVPPGSFLVVAYTMAQYEKDKAFYLSTNILYGILFATEFTDNVLDPNNIIEVY